MSDPSTTRSTFFPDEVVIGTAPNNGLIVFKDCLHIGYTDWVGTDTARVYNGSATQAEAGGIAIVANPS